MCVELGEGPQNDNDLECDVGTLPPFETAKLQLSPEAKSDQETACGLITIAGKTLGTYKIAGALG